MPRVRPAAGRASAPTRFHPRRRQVRLVDVVDDAVRAVPRALPVRGDQGVELRLRRPRHFVEAVPVLPVEPEHRVGEVGVAEEDERHSRLHAARHQLVLERQIPPRRPGGGVIEERHQFIAGGGDAAEMCGVDARAEHRVADEHPSWPPGPEVIDDIVTERLVRAPDFQRRQVAERRQTADHGAIDGAERQGYYEGANRQHGDEKPAPDKR
jgi:hypothetical protein